MKPTASRIALTIFVCLAMLLTASPALATHFEIDFVYTATWWTDPATGNPDEESWTGSFWPGQNISLGAKVDVPDGTTVMNWLWNITGPCGYNYNYPYSTSYPPYGFGGWTYLPHTLPANACKGTYTYTFTGSHNGGATESKSTTFEVGMDAPLGGVPVSQTYGQGGGHGANPSATFKDPVNTATGSYVTTATDISLPGIGLPFRFARHYNSADATAGPLGIGWTHEYAPTLTITSTNATLRAEDGQVVTWTRDSTWPDFFLRDPGVHSLLTVVGSDYQVRRKDQVLYRFDSTGRLTQYKDRNNNALNLSYGTSGKLETITDTVGRTISFTNDPVSGLLTRVEVPDGRYVAFGYTGNLLTSVRDVRGNTTTYGYDLGNRLDRITDQNGNPHIRNTYGPDGRVIAQTDAVNEVTAYAWDSLAQTATMTDRRGGIWKDVYSENVLIKRIDPLGNTTSYGWDAALDLRRMQNPRGDSTYFTYDNIGNRKVVLHPEPFGREEFNYNANNDLTRSTKQNNASDWFDYNATGNLIRITEEEGIVTQFGYDTGGKGLLTSITDPRSKTTTFEYDALGNRTKATSPSGAIRTFAYDAAGRVANTVEARGNVAGANPDDYRWRFTYNEAGQPLTVTDPLNHVTTSVYDPVGRLTSRTDAKQRVTQFGYDTADRLSTVTAPDTTVTTYGYDAAWNLTSRTDAKQHTTSYGYDGVNRLTSVTSPTMQRWNYEYDPNGNRTKVIDAIGNSTPADPTDGTSTFTFDKMDRLTRITYSDGTPTVTFAYNSTGQRKQMTDGAGTETYEYDMADRLKKVTRGTNIFQYLYDAASNVTKRTLPDGTVSDYTFDDEGRLATVTTAGAVTSYGYDVASNLTSTTLPSGNGHVETQTWDRAGRLTEVRNTKSGNTLSYETLTLDEVGNPTSAITQAGTITYAYDPLDRLTGACYTPPTCSGSGDFLTYAYDAVGNRTTETRAAGTTTYAYNNADQLTSQSGVNGAKTYTYDANGNQKSAGSDLLTYNTAGQTKTIKVGNTTTTYTYDGDGKRTEGSTGTQASKKTRYLWDRNAGLPLLSLERDGNNALVRRYQYGNDLISMVSGSSSYYHHYDTLGSVKNLTSSTGAAQWTYGYDPFGKLRSEVKNNNSAPTNLMRYTGELFDAGTGLYHLRARQYDPATGRFTQTDPVAPQITDPYVASYVYVNNRPTVMVDPSGRVVWLVIAAAALGGAAIGGIGTASQGGDSGDIARGMFIGGVMGGVSAAIPGSTIFRAAVVGAGAGIATDYAGQVAQGNWNSPCLSSLPYSAIGGAFAGASGFVAGNASRVARELVGLRRSGHAEGTLAFGVGAIAGIPSGTSSITCGKSR